MKNRIGVLEEETEQLNEYKMNSEIKFLTEKDKKLAAQKANSYLRHEVNELRVKMKNNENHDECNRKLVSLQLCMEEKEHEIKLLQEDLEQANGELTDTVRNLKFDKKKLKNENGSYSNEVRLCIMELSGLEVAVEKMSPVIQAISKHLFDIKLEKQDLPSSSTTQTIVDEGHFVAKSYISNQLSETTNWGLHRDGTSRKKQKLLDTSVKLASGETMSLGFNRVAHETADAIHTVTKDHLTELADLHSNKEKNESDEDYIKSSLERLSYTMSDRAANEKKADKLLDEWRSEVLQNTDNQEQVQHFHCMAHVLLGFHNYICGSDLKELESDVAEKNGPLGRDVLPCFKYWSKKGTVLERTLRTTSEVFGPAGSHHGVRDSWEAHCAENGIKSTIGNYKDNRFNALFQTAAEVFHHREDFITVLKNVKSNNLLVQSVLADLQSGTIMTEVKCMGLFYLQLTGPYWNAVVNDTVPYLELYKEVQCIHMYLTELEKNPSAILEHVPFSDKDMLKVPHHELYLMKLVQNDDNDFSDLFHRTVRMSACAMKRTVEKQLSDFLEDGKFGGETSEKDSKRTEFAPISNLTCEHHFGHLDSSQRKRPGASLHHHTSVQLLKQNRRSLMEWLSDMSKCKKDNLLKAARNGGRKLRQKHKEYDKSVLSQINNENLMNKQKNLNKKRKTDSKIKNKEKAPRLMEEEADDWNEKEAQLTVNCEKIFENTYVAVAYHDSWYPGIVTNEIDTDYVIVKFMHPTRPGHFKWPSREDKQTVNRRFIISAGFIPDCVNSGRQWKLVDAPQIDNIYKKYSKIYF